MTFEMANPYCLWHWMRVAQEVLPKHILGSDHFHPLNAPHLHSSRQTEGHSPQYFSVDNNKNELTDITPLCKKMMTATFFVFSFTGGDGLLLRHDL